MEGGVDGVHELEVAAEAGEEEEEGDSDQSQGYAEQRGQIHRATGVPCRIPISLHSESGAR